ITVADADRPVEVTDLRKLFDVGADTEPQQIQTAPAPITRLHKTATEFDTSIQIRFGLVFVIGKQRVAVTLLDGCVRDTGAAQPIRTHQLQRFVVPQYDMVVIAVVGIDITAATTALADGAETDFAKASDF